MRVVMRTVAAAAAVATLTAASCSAPNRAAVGDSVGTPAAAPRVDAPSANDTLTVRTRLETDARALAKTSGCSSASQCRTAPVGARACGGPRTYIAYCAATTDSVSLFRKLDELKAAELRINQSSGMMSTCEFRMPPAVSVQGGSCRASTP